jgi:polyphosphate kinase
VFLLATGTTVRELQRIHRHALEQDLLPALRRHGIMVHLSTRDLVREERLHLEKYFEANVFPVLTPLAIDPTHPFPYISNLSQSLAVRLRDQNGEERLARVKVPKILPRWVRLAAPQHYMPLELLVGEHLDRLFPGVEILSWHSFRITRNTDLQIDSDEEADDLLSLIQEEVRNRKFGEVVRLEVHASMPPDLRHLLLEEFSAEQEQPAAALTHDDVYDTGGLLDTADLIQLGMLDMPALHDAAFAGVTPLRLQTQRSIFDVIREGDLFLHHPYDSFLHTVERFIQAAADDPDVLAIKLTLYRTGGDSSIARMLALAAERGKQVAVLIELQARFDEENNIKWAQRLEDVGVHVSYGVPGLKTHAKVLLVVRREGDTMRRYVHIGTGNYNTRSARSYTDFGLLSCHPDLGADLTDLFNQLTGFAQPIGFRRIVTAPNGYRQRFTQLIERETAHAKAGRPGHILAKMNALVDQQMIAALYEAARHGVRIDLIVRGICCLRPGVPGVSESIRVISVVGKLLEHSRAFWFRNGGDDEAYIGSGDWMPRNLDRRVEAAAPVIDPVHRAHLRQVLELMWNDNRQAWELDADGSYTQRRPAPGEPDRSTHRLLTDQSREAARAH